MKATGLFMFKCLNDRQKGSFTNKETGEVVDYEACKVLVCDEIISNTEMKERHFKVSNDNASLINDLNCLEPYTKINLVFDVLIYSSNVKITPVSFDVV